MVILMIFFLSFSKMNDLERASTHIHDKISSLKHLLDMSGATWCRVLAESCQSFSTVAVTVTRRCCLRPPGAEKLFLFWPLGRAAVCLSVWLSCRTHLRSVPPSCLSYSVSLCLFDADIVKPALCKCCCLFVRW